MQTKSATVPTKTIEKTDRRGQVTPARKLRRMTAGPSTSKPFARFTGRTGAAKSWEFLKGLPAAREKRAFARKLLGRMATTEALLSAGLRDAQRLAIAERFPRMYALTRAETQALLAVPGVGPKTVAHLRDFLASKGVEVAW